ncbi:unnamed protein product, partial [Brenthis ino]
MAAYDWHIDTQNYPVMRIVSPRNVVMRGIYGMSFAYYSLKERLPIILTKVIDYLSRESGKIKSAHGASDEDIRSLIQYITKLKNDLVTNKKYELLTVDTPEAKKWNEFIQNSDCQYYFTNVWVFSECYVYRRLREGCELTKNLRNFDPFDEQKEKAFMESLEPMCVVADKLVTMLPESDKDKRKSDFATLLKICLWANKCDLSLSMGEQVNLKDDASITSRKLLDPFQLVLDLKDKVLVDDTAKICDLVITKAESMAKAIEGCPEEVKMEKAEGEQEEQPEHPPCPAKMTTPQCVTFDIVCDNSGYELFSDLCLAHFLISQNIVKKVRFHVKKIPWFVSDVTPKDFEYVINACAQASFSKEVPPEPRSETADGESVQAEGPRIVTSENLRNLGKEWMKYYEDGTFVVMCDDFWTYPHVYKDMKLYDPQLYRKLQFAIAVLFKGDLNYRKLLGEINCNPSLGFEAALQGFMPAPVIALRTVKADLICGLPKGKWEQLNKIDEKWMEKGDYGVIQFCAKSEALKVADRPCAEYGETCSGDKCGQHMS